jgi:hypothetical protein
MSAEHPNIEENYGDVAVVAPIVPYYPVVYPFWVTPENRDATMAMLHRVRMRMRMPMMAAQSTYYGTGFGGNAVNAVNAVNTVNAVNAVNTVNAVNAVHAVHLDLPRIRTTRVVQNNNPANSFGASNYEAAGPIQYGEPSTAVVRSISGFDSDAPATVRYKHARLE